MTIEERLDAIKMALELALRDSESQRLRISALTKVVEIDAENIRALARIASPTTAALTV